MKRADYYLIRFIYATILMLISVLTVEGQVRIKGRIVNASTKEPISTATIKSEEHNTGASATKTGAFELILDKPISSILVTALGFVDKRVEIDTFISYLQIELDPKNFAIEAVEVNRKRKYNNHNPAVELIDLVIKNRSLNKLEKKDSLYFESYEKIKFGLMDPKNIFGRQSKDLKFFYSNVDTSIVSEKEALSVFMQETLSDNYVQQSPARTKKIVKAEEKTEFDPRYVNNPNIESFMGFMFQPIDIYEESIYFLNKQFLSPIASNAKLYYKYYIKDTLRTERDIYVRIEFEPRNPVDLLFKGELAISMDGQYAVKSAQMRLDEKVNVSFVNDLQLQLSYFKDVSGVMLQDTSAITVTFGRGTKDALFGHRMNVNQKYDLRHIAADGIFMGSPVEKRLSARKTLQELRPIQLSSSEQSTYTNIDSLNNLTSFRTMMAMGYLLSQGYYSLGKFELGPLEYLYHQNNIEGNRIRIGGRSTAAFSEKVYLEGYLAYGIKDQDLKYNLRTAVSLNGKSIVAFPAHYLEASVQHDIFEPGKGIGFLKGDSFFRGFRSNRPAKFLNTDAYRIGHMIEFGNHVSLSSKVTLQRRNPVGDLRFALSADSTQFLNTINTSDLQFVLRWAPNEKFYYRNLNRTTIVEKYPVFNIQYNKGLNGFLGGDYNYDALRFSASKRFFLNQLGFGNMTISAGKIWGTLPYPLLEMPNIQENKDRHTISYERVNSMEFVADQYLKLAYDHRLNGFLLNKIPLIKKLKLREVFGARMFWGDLSQKNNPYMSNDVVYFDKDTEGKILTNVMGKDPYWEGYVGLDNIFRVLRVQYYVRMTYNEIKEPIRDRFRLSLHFSF
ncbi:DUF5686 family protein [Sphingobacterium bovistauri]|uniref:Carboxypeptidase-like regulatory domain-containing protein n=1 Tax=Sphingobacterium bovistauri TaxID=2781959 RepID=A0ABS7Z1D0_9SPHI|nr:DUF5686 family protein [Sphingobacterium bovistauri]MCA5003983.1 carboxypeptidase-like regulatory domain-containing protein [Sphingobacterium bovistauri]